MSDPIPTVQFFEGIPEHISNVSLRRDKNSGMRVVVMTFEDLQSLTRFNSFTKKFSQALILADAEGQMELQPASVKFIFGGDDGDDLQRMECKLEIDQDQHWDRFMRFMHRYAEANGMAYGEPEDQGEGVKPRH
ncbi:photosystem II reaction center protein Psb28 [Neosynechococcus sphagnicola]|uniref:photosystem II reaction center protein Psb28 n=1 Tax=Neosynechococcus sphagnicola TaxID=1501145 RepID=UPI00055C9E27|nr:photosystem II reaction center protein Psb28 [Neosynechococcus sphagnicola]